MTNTIANVPRELLEEVMLAAQRMPVRGPSIRAKLHALLSTPSPAGVDGLEVVGWQQRYIDPDEGVSAWGHADARTASILQGRSDYELRPLYAVPIDAQSIIDGLRGEVERLDRESQNLSNQLGACSRDRNMFRTERDQQAQRIGELEGLLDRVKVSLSLDDTEWGYSAPEKYKLLADIRAALSAGKEKQDEHN